MFILTLFSTKKCKICAFYKRFCFATLFSRVIHVYLFQKALFSYYYNMRNTCFNYELVVVCKYIL
jgi:hypothetical protein